ncbi:MULTISPECIES: transcriptional regulator FtrA [Citrobacter]|jgi:AraC family transcriptional activator FtrA|uniref:transcriptional regulator FtrA n=1 Tax=Citrobacter TaxID=544 RepID=UPI000CEF2306|nr:MULTISPECIES: transcriptional regulator FtrA [Citrobacter]MBR7616079.1 transcriptional regulator FtrA [Citrobacter braakii]MDL4474055.1 transcriptional regulator FtrA [Citrobacter braakii]MDL4505784.1 transcriptional regulator FtrA [Citrobacter braakii]MDM3378409.1 transcriptional regulator FtrA [Citrobacter sp. Cb003]MDM3447583.1 transcriptional regulator FtrA [Citrobacter sp. Cb027]
MTDSARIMTTSSRPLVVALAYDGLCTFEFGVAVEVFGLPRPELGEGWYRFAVASVDQGELRATGGVRIVVDGGYELLQEADTIVIPGWRDVSSPVPEALCDALREAHQRGCRVISICSGVFVLAAAGLLDDRKATTHWRYVSELQRRFPAINVVEDVLYVGGHDVLTSAGSAAGIDLCLHVVRTDFGLEVANNVARRLVLQPHRDGSQTQQHLRPVARSRESQRFGLLLDWLHNNIAQKHTLDALASQVGMSPRTLMRRFQESTGLTPARWLMNERLNRAQQALNTSHISIEQIAQQTGFGSANSLRYHFQKRFGISPQALRNQMR